jgi:DNA polymerase III gamma/tau subunit
MASTQQLLLETAARGELHHSIILFGGQPELLRSMAISIARVVNCETSSGEDNCASCTKIDRGVHPDIHIVSVGDDRKLIAVEQIRDIVSGASMRPYEARTKVYIIESADAMSTSGANALLKTLEEPTRDTMFLLLTRTPELLLPTIRSRSQSVPIRDDLRLSAGELATRERIPMQVARLRVLFPAADSKELLALAREFTTRLHAYAAHGDSAALLGLAALFANESDSSNSLALFAALLRDTASLDPQASVDAEKVSAIREAISPRRLFDAASLALRGVSRLVVNVDERLVLEQVVATLAAKK